MKVSEKDAAGHGADRPVSSLMNTSWRSLWRYLWVNVCPARAMFPMRLGSDVQFGIVVGKTGTF